MDADSAAALSGALAAFATGGGSYVLVRIERIRQEAETERQRRQHAHEIHLENLRHAHALELERESREGDS
ncbi:hypothetical protein [Streptomyces synnematoformans]